MGKFKLVSEMTPKGDQPQAIAKLVEGIRAGKRFQTLLGATGTGKSLPPEEPVWIHTESEGKPQPFLTSIGPWIDEIINEAGSQVVSKYGTEVVDAGALSKSYSALSFSPATNAIELKLITHFIRHRAPSSLCRIKTQCGREVTVTADHNFWVLREGKISLIRTNEIRDSDYLPIPLSLPPVDQDLVSLDSIRMLDGEPLFVRLTPLICQAIVGGRRKKAVEVLRRYYRFPEHKLSKILSGRRLGGGMPYQVLKEVVRECGLELTPADIQEVGIGSQFQKYTIPGQLPVSDALLRLIGYYVADGHGEPESRFFTITAADSSSISEDLPRVLSEFGLAYRKCGIDFHIASQTHAVLLSRLCGTSARFKRLPPFWLQLSQRQLAELLAAYLEGDGAVTSSNGVVAVTGSKQLASDLLYTLLRFGIWARVYKMWQRAANSDHTGNTYWFVTVSGEENLRTFQKHLRFLSKRKQSALLQKVENTHDAQSDLIPGAGAAILRLREEAGVTQQALAEGCGLSRTTLSVVEAGIATPRRSTVQKLYREGCSLLGSGHQAIQELEQRMRCRWTRVKGIENVPSEGSYVYDLSVDGNETFFAGFGGLFLHNTFVMANMIQQVQKPTLIISHNKLLAAQLYSELKSFFPENAVEYFVSYYDYYQPEAYIPQTDTYIEKDASINDRLDRLRLSSTTSLLSREDVVIVASVSCIYNLGSPEDYRQLLLFFEEGQEIPRQELLHRLVGLLYERNDIDFTRGRFRVRGETVEIFPAYEETPVRLEVFGDRIERISMIDPVTGDVLQRLEKLALYPAKHFITTADRIERALVLIEHELQERLKELQDQGKLLEAQRLQARTRYDMEMMREVGFCHGIENYSRALSGRPPGSRPWCLLDYFPARPGPPGAGGPTRPGPGGAGGPVRQAGGPKDFLTIIDESHVTIPQLRGMYEGDRSRKEILVEFGFRLPSCLDNRPLKFEEFLGLIGQTLFVSATPGPYELKVSGGAVVEQIIRPTGLVDPPIEVKPVEGQVDDLIHQVRGRVKEGERSLVTTLTKRMAEDLAQYLKEAGLRVTYIHSDLDAFERVEVLKNLRLGNFDCVVGVNLLREGLDLPEVSLVLVLDADKEGFLRSPTSLIQVAGRAARHIHGSVILYADSVTEAMDQAIKETERRRKIQLAYNREHGITPRSVEKAIRAGIEEVAKEEVEEVVASAAGFDPDRFDIEEVVAGLEQEMELAARNLQFERAAGLRDQIAELRRKGVAGLATLELEPKRTRRVRRWKRRF